MSVLVFMAPWWAVPLLIAVGLPAACLAGRIVVRRVWP